MREYIIAIDEKDVTMSFINGMRNAELIRCKDCRYLRYNGSAWTCANRSVKMLNEMNDYCSRAERKEE